MSRDPKKFCLRLMPHEIEALTAPVGNGGHQAIHRLLVDQLAVGNKLYLDDAQMGAVIRCMTQYKSGGFQGRLRKALLRPLIKQIVQYQ